MGGIKGTLGLAEDRAEASIACRQIGPIQIAQPLKQQEEVFNERISLVFKRLRVVRMVDEKRHTLVYLTYSDKLIDGSPQNSATRPQPAWQSPGAPRAHCQNSPAPTHRAARARRAAADC